MRPRRGQRGFTLLETAVGMGLTSLVLSLAVGVLFQAWTLQDGRQEKMFAGEQLRYVNRWFVRDALDSQSTDLVDGGPPVSTVTLNWTDTSQTQHTATYRQEGPLLMRTLDGAALPLTALLAGVAFSRSGDTVFMSLSVDSGRGRTESLDTRVFMRAAQGVTP